MSEYCEACIGCKKVWSADMKTSCHNFCEEYQKWKHPFATVYLGGAIDKVPPEFALGWRKEATKVLKEHGFAILDPTAGKDLYAPTANISSFTPEYIVTTDLTMIETSDILLIEISRKDVPYHGTSMEIVYAYQWGKKIFVWGGSMSYWVRYHADQVFITMEDALDHIVYLKKCNDVLKYG